jgi:putative membrane protein
MSRSRSAKAFRRFRNALCVTARILAPAAVLASGPATVFAHVETSPVTNPWTTWPFTPDIVIGTLVVGAFYALGMAARAGRQNPLPWWRHASFFGGLILVFIALQSPADIISEHVFAVHQVQHLLLHTVGPMFLMLAAPQILLTAGTPEILRRWVLAPIMENRAVRGFFRLLAQPVVATLLFIGSLYFWQIPHYHNLALLNNGVHYLMHATMLVAGLVFFWRVFDPRPAPLGARYGVRLAMLWITVVGNILIGTILTLKNSVLYPAYDQLGRWFGFTALPDEQLGGIVLWIPGSMMCLLAILVVVALWGSQEARADERRQRGIAPGAPRPGGSPVSSAAGAAVAASRNRALALRLGMIALAVFAALIGVVVLSQL